MKKAANSEDLLLRRLPISRLVVTSIIHMPPVPTVTRGHKQKKAATTATDKLKLSEYRNIVVGRRVHSCWTGSALRHSTQRSADSDFDSLGISYRRHAGFHTFLEDTERSPPRSYDIIICSYFRWRAHGFGFSA